MFGRNSASVASFGAMDTGMDESNIPQQTEKSQEILILGSEGAGKTLLTKRLQGLRIFSEDEPFDSLRI